MDSFPEWSDDDSRELDDFLSRPWPDNTNSVRTNKEGWPEFLPRANKWDQLPFSNRTSRIVSITAVASDDEEGEHRNDCNSRNNDCTDARDANVDGDADDESVLTLSSMASATMELARTARQSNTPTSKPQRLLRQKLPMLLCKSERGLKQPSPGDKRVRFALHNEKNQAQTAAADDEHMMDPIIEIGVDGATEIIKPLVPVLAVESSSLSTMPQPRPRTGVQKKFCFEDDAPIQAYAGKCSPSSWIHNANLFHDKTLPSNTLDFFCRDSGLAGSAVPSVREVSYSEEDTVSSSSTGSGISSLVGGAVDAKLAQVFSLCSIHEETAQARPSTRAESRRNVSPKTGTRENGARDPPAQPVTAVRQYPTAAAAAKTSKSAARRDPPAETRASYTPGVSSAVAIEEASAPSRDAFDCHQVNTSVETSDHDELAHHDAKFSHMPASGSKVADRQKWLNEAFKRPTAHVDDKTRGIPMSRVSQSIERFGGRSSRQSAVQRKRQELERKLASEKQKPCFKTKWEGRPGSYKKKVVYSSSHY